MLKVVEKQDAREASEELLPLDEIAREGARRMLIEALKAEVDDYVERHKGERDEHGRALVVRNGRGQARKLTLGARTVELKAPRVDDRRHDEQGGRRRFSSRILPPYMRRSPKVAEVLPILYLRGPSTGDFRPALEGLLGEDAARSVADQHHPTYRHLGKRIHGLSPARSGRARVRLCVGRWGALQYPARRRPALHPGDDRRAARRRKGVARGRGWLPGERRELEDAAARSQATRDGRPGGSGGRRRAGILGRRARGVARDSRAGLLVPQARQCARQAAPAATTARQARAPRDDVRRGPRRLRGRPRAFRGGVSAQVLQGGRVADGQLVAAGYFLRLSRRALEASAYHQRDRVAVRHRTLARARDQRRRFQKQGTADGVQAARDDAASLA